ncbi:MAG TPA: nuclear transport factor 2 family protein [Phenylobacterium sp.]
MTVVPERRSKGLGFNNGGVIAMNEGATTVDVPALLRALCDSCEKYKGETFADLFTEDGVYHDVFYGAFKGREGLEAFNRLVFGAGEDYRWDMFDPVTDGRMVYARYVFSYRSTLPEANGARAIFEGVSMIKLRDGKIAEYREIALTAPALVEMNFAPERIARLAAKQGAELKGRAEAQRHLAD